MPSAVVAVAVTTPSASVPHTYPTAGTYTVRLIATGPVGVSTNTKLDFIRVINPPQLTVSPDSQDYGAVTIGSTNTLAFSVITV